MTIANLIIFYLISMIVVASIPAFIELKRWKDAYDKQERIAKFIDEFDNSMNNIESHEDIDEYIRESILYD